MMGKKGREIVSGKVTSSSLRADERGERKGKHSRCFICLTNPRVLTASSCLPSPMAGRKSRPYIFVNVNIGCRALIHPVETESSLLDPRRSVISLFLVVSSSKMAQSGLDSLSPIMLQA
jgi:hypothetical protein